LARESLGRGDHRDRGARLGDQPAPGDETSVAARALIAAAVCLAILGLVRTAQEYVFTNWTPSMAEGFYVVSPARGHYLGRRGDVVQACLPARYGLWAQAHNLLGPGQCGGVEPVVKRVVAVRGDFVRIDAGGVRVNVQLLAGTQASPYLGAVTPHVPYGERRLGNEVVLISDNRAKGYDSRYVGPVPTANVMGSARRLLPLWVLIALDAAALLGLLWIVSVTVVLALRGRRVPPRSRSCS
jgi:type IV secretory pathway protease TraF